MNTSLPDAFFQLASARLSEHPELLHTWEGPEPDGKRVLSIPKKELSGFDVRIECESYGLYPFADGWHGPPWDANPKLGSAEEIAEQCLGFVRTILSADAKLLVHHAGGKPFKWILTYPTESGPAHDETGLLFFNYFGGREIREYQNRQLPGRYGGTAT